MADERNKSVRIDGQLNKAINALAGYLDLRSDEVVAQGIAMLWDKTFPSVAMPAGESKRKR